MTPETTTVIIDGPHEHPGGGQMTRIVTLDGHGCEIGWCSIDTAGHGYGPTAEHPERAFFRWPRGYRQQPFSLYNNVDEGWACPSYEQAIEAALYEHAARLDEDWWARDSECCYEAAPPAPPAAPTTNVLVTEHGSELRLRPHPYQPHLTVLEITQGIGGNAGLVLTPDELALVVELVADRGSN